MKTPGIHFRILFSVFLLICSAIFVLGYLGAGMVQSFVMSRFEERNEFLARYLARNAELGILIDNRQMLQTLAQNLLSESDVVRVRIFDSENVKLAEVSNQASGPVATTEAVVFLKSLNEESSNFPWRKEKSSGQKHIGKVQITYSMKEINRLQKALQLRFILLALGVAGIAVFVFYFISRSLVTPISKLAKTARKVARGEKKVRALPDKIPETKDLALAFNSMLDSLEESNQALEEAYQEMMQQKTLAEFGRVSMVIAHEVKNPLGIIKGSLDVLKKDLDLKDGNTMVEYIEDEIQRLNRLIEDFLAFSKPAKPSFRSTELNSLLSDCILRFETQLVETHIDIHKEIPEENVYTNADPDLLNRAFINLLRNGVEANGKQGVLWVRSFCEDNLWITEIEDQGPGIDPEIQDKIFEPFFTTRSKGSGLGLAYVSQVLIAHRGEVQARNMPEKGAVFRIVLPFASKQ